MINDLLIKNITKNVAFSKTELEEFTQLFHSKSIKKKNSC
ncbi:hypothetical protein JCM19274_1192 [Algibacter lectus]|uniref:Uncharacterized protein n=1 Tax=Algibacter lectus TaxID=221126 RepID=A0A090WU93_9FLAO|nr:hypothetical protein JCM19274_1192 [Algibacter lectus]